MQTTKQTSTKLITLVIIVLSLLRATSRSSDNSNPPSVRVCAKREHRTRISQLLNNVCKAKFKRSSSSLSRISNSGEPAANRMSFPSTHSPVPLRVYTALCGTLVKNVIHHFGFNHFEHERMSSNSYYVIRIHILQVSGVSWRSSKFINKAIKSFK